MKGNGVVVNFPYYYILESSADFNISIGSQ